MSSLRRSFATRHGNRMALRPGCCHEDLRRSGEVAAGQSGRETEHRRTGLLKEWLKNCQYPVFPPALRTRPKLRRTMGAFSADRHAAVRCDSPSKLRPIRWTALQRIKSSGFWNRLLSRFCPG